MWAVRSISVPPVRVPALPGAPSPIPGSPARGGLYRSAVAAIEAIAAWSWFHVPMEKPPARGHIVKMVFRPRRRRVHGPFALDPQADACDRELQSPNPNLICRSGSAQKWQTSSQFVRFCCFSSTFAAYGDFGNSAEGVLAFDGYQITDCT
jgi:hypothetical protein